MSGKIVATPPELKGASFAPDFDIANQPEHTEGTTDLFSSFR
jgi:hypothetical protein